eukprot:230552-Rhodomonas_salina.2
MLSETAERCRATGPERHRRLCPRDPRRSLQTRGPVVSQRHHFKFEPTLPSIPANNRFDSRKQQNSETEQASQRTACGVASMTSSVGSPRKDPVSICHVYWHARPAAVTVTANTLNARSGRARNLSPALFSAWIANSAPYSRVPENAPNVEQSQSPTYCERIVMSVYSRVTAKGALKQT